MSIREIFNWAAAESAGQMIGTIAGPFVQLAVDGDHWLWAVDVNVMVGGTPQTWQNVPVASNNHELLYAQQGMAVSLSQNGAGGWSVTGLSNTSIGLGHVMYVSFNEDVASIVREAMIGSIIRPLTLGELGSLSPAGFGFFPFGCRGRFSAAGDLLEILEN